MAKNNLSVVDLILSSAACTLLIAGGIRNTFILKVYWWRSFPVLTLQKWQFQIKFMCNRSKDDLRKILNLTTYTDHLREMLLEMMKSNEWTDVTLICGQGNK